MLASGRHEVRRTIFAANSRKSLTEALKRCLPCSPISPASLNHHTCSPHTALLRARSSCDGLDMHAQKLSDALRHRVLTCTRSARPKRPDAVALCDAENSADDHCCRALRCAAWRSRQRAMRGQQGVGEAAPPRLCSSTLTDERGPRGHSCVCTHVCSSVACQNHSRRRSLVPMWHVRAFVESGVLCLKSR